MKSFHLSSIVVASFALVGFGGVAQTAHAQTDSQPRRITLESAQENSQDNPQALPSTDAAPRVLRQTADDTSEVDLPPAPAQATPQATQTQDSPSAETQIDDTETEASQGKELIADPWEETNRDIFAVNDFFDRNAIQPVARGYQTYVPSGLRRCGGNMLDNLGTPSTALNNLLQGKLWATCQDLGRLVVNTTFGLGGCFDVATDWGLPKHDEDFGQTLAVWGVPSGRFVVLPGFGPSTVRDTVGRAVDMFTSPLSFIRHKPVRYSLSAYKVVEVRASLLEITDMIDETALDRYAMMRDGWIQSRIAQINDEDGTGEESSSARPPFRRGAPTGKLPQPDAAGQPNTP